MTSALAERKAIVVEPLVGWHLHNLISCGPALLQPCLCVLQHVLLDGHLLGSCLLQQRLNLGDAADALVHTQKLIEA